MIRELALLLLIAQFWCPMHPDERSEVRRACGICGMTLVRMPPASFATYPVDLRVTPTLAGARLRLAVRHPATRTLVRNFSIVHERSLHLFVVGDGLEYFTHVHPVQQPDGVFMLDVSLPRQGPYMAIAEFLPEGATPQLFQQAFTTGDAFGRRPPPPVDASSKTVDGLRVSVNVSTLRSGGTGTIVFRIEDAVSGAPVTNLEPYLGASAHLLIVPVDLTEAIHGHPAADDAGPSLSFAPVIPRAGRYKMWLQIQRGGRVATAPFVIDVPSA